MEVCEELKILAEEFHSLEYKLYIVGGFVRDQLLGLINADIDITSNMPEEQVEKICNKIGAKISNINRTLGTIQIRLNKRKFEYTRFRNESYSHTGDHTPETVKFVDNIDVDCFRRDFTINALYYDILEDKIIDIARGQKDLQTEVIRTVQDPYTTFSDDALRILRAVRFASTLNFSIEKNTLKALKCLAPYLKSISKERILKELNYLVVADKVHEKSNFYFMELLKQLNLSQYIFNSSLARSKRFSKKDIHAFYNLDKDARLIGFYIIIMKNYLKTYTQDAQLSFAVNMLLGRNGIKESNEKIYLSERIYKIYQNLQYQIDPLNACVNYLTLSTTERHIVDAFLNKKAKKYLQEKIAFVEKNNLPISIHHMDICAQDLIEAGIEKKYISKIMSTIYNQVLNMCVENKKDKIIELAIQINETFNQLKEKI